MDTSEQLQTAISVYQQGDFNTAITLCQKILAHEPTHAEVLNLLGVAQNECQQYALAVESLQKAINASPAFHAAHYNLGAVFKAQNQLDDALPCYQRALQLAPDHINTLVVLADIYTEQRHYEHALSYLQHAIGLAPESPLLHKKIGDIFSLLEQSTQADEYHFYAQLYETIPTHNQKKIVALCDKFLTIYPNQINALIHKGVALEAMKQFQLAVNTYDQALALDPTIALVLFNKGNVQQSIGLYEEALVSHNAAISLQHDFLRPIMNRGFLNLLLGNYIEGWRDYENRLTNAMDGRSEDRVIDYYQFKDKQWSGDAQPNDYLHLWNEQGIGDEILFSSIFNDVSPYFKKIIIESDARLVDLFKRSFPHMEVIPRKSIRDYVFPNDNTVWHLPFGSVGKFFRNSLSDFTQHAQHLVSDTHKTAVFTSSFKKDSNALIGLSWASSGPTGAHKTLPLEPLALVLSTFSQASFVCLQYHATENDKKALAQHGVDLNIPTIDLYNEIDALAALINACDYIITCSNLTAHIAGALGKPTFLLAPTGDGLLWYWGIESTTPWYPSVRIIRQDQPGNWSSALSELNLLLGKDIGGSH